MKAKFTLLLLAVLFFLNSTKAQDRYLAGVLQASQEVSVVNSPATGVVIVKYNTSTNVLELFGNYRNLTATVSGSHIHGPAGPGANAGILFQLINSGGTSGSLSGNFTISDAQEADLLAGNMYVNVHSTGPYAGGEIRAQLIATTIGLTQFFTARLQGAQSTPPNGSLATGSAYAIIDPVTNKLFLTGSYTGLTTPASNAHIHTGAPTASGGVIVPLKFSTTASGSLDTSVVLTVPVRDDILAGNTYVNVHTSTYPMGEIRGQLTQLSQMWFFANALQGSQQFPANASPARGTVIVRYIPQIRRLELVGDYQNLSAPISASHVHSPAAAGANAGVLFDLNNTGGVTGLLTATATLTALQEADLLAGNMYANVHSTGTYAGGEIRAQLLPTAMGATQVFAGLMQASQSVASPAVVSSGTGNVAVLLDKVSNMVYVTGGFSGLTSNISNTHIHGGAAGTNGPVAVPLFYSGTTAGTITGTGIVSSTFADSMVNGFSYLNIHTVNYGAGEIRAQLGDLVLPVKLRFFNGFKEKERVILVWESEEESNLSVYEIEQQDSRLQWISKAVVPASNKAVGNNYRFADIPLNGSGNDLYYRLKMIDKDGKYDYSKVVRINNLQSGAGLKLLSNPVSNGDLRFLITGIAGDRKAAVSIIDFSGKIISQKIVSSMATNSINIKRLPAGMYKIVVRVDDKQLQETFMK
ncbi:MAG: CHRD domain-containing protein [Ferruginibacter sp.]